MIQTQKCTKVRRPRLPQSPPRARARVRTHIATMTKTQTRQRKRTMTLTRLSTSSRRPCPPWQRTGRSDLCHGVGRRGRKLSCSMVRPSRMADRALGKVKREGWWVLELLCMRGSCTFTVFSVSCFLQCKLFSTSRSHERTVLLRWWPYTTIFSSQSECTRVDQSVADGPN